VRPLSGVWRVAGGVRRLLLAAADDAPSPYIWCYTRSGTTIRGILVGRDSEAYTLEHADVAPEGAAGFRQLRGRVRIPIGNVDYYCEGEVRR
jgi:hypothetical protein